jgi:hypothetical protein
MATTNITVECCVCGKIKTSHGWARSETKRDEPKSHGYCPACFKVAITEIVNVQAMQQANAMA